MRTRRIYDHPAWRTVRKAVLERDSYTCRIATPGICLGHATDVDHIVTLANGGQPYDPDNLRAACHPCNASRRRPVYPGPSRDWTTR